MNNHNVILYVFFFFFFFSLLPVGPRSLKIQYLIQQRIIEYGDLGNFLSTMIAAYHLDDDVNKYLNAGRTLCEGRRRFIVELINKQEHIKKIMFLEMIRKVMLADVYAAKRILEEAIKNLNK